MHFHIIWGSNTAEVPAIISFENKEEAVKQFIEIIKAVEGEGSRPPPYEEIKYNSKTTFIRCVSATHKYIIVYCDNECEIIKENKQPILN